MSAYVRKDRLIDNAFIYNLNISVSVYVMGKNVKHSILLAVKTNLLHGHWTLGQVQK